MVPAHDIELNRVSETSQKLIIAARTSCVEGSSHIAESREIIARSLALLSKPYWGFWTD
jgi:hypothetical protein